MTSFISAFDAVARAALVADFALIMISLPVNELTPLRTLRAGLITRRIYTQ